MNKLSLGIDIGSTSLKAVLYDYRTKTPVHTLSAQLDARVLPLKHGYYEEDPRLIRQETHELIRQACKYAKEHSHQIMRVAFTGQMHGGLFVDSDLRPLSNFITWQDKRVDEQEAHGHSRLIDRIREHVPESIWLETGGPIYTGFLGATAYWFILHDLVPVGTAKIIGIYDWLASELCGSAAITDPSSAASWGLYSIRDSSWSQPIIQGLKIPDSWLPEVKECGVPIGQISPGLAGELGISAETIVTSGLGDTQASYLGSGCRPDELLINIGTGSQCMWEHDAFALFPDTDTRYLSPGRYLITIPTLSGGLAYALMRDFIADLLSQFDHQVPLKSTLYARMNQLALEAGAQASGVAVRPFFNGSRARGEELRGSIEYLKRDNFSIGNILRATLEGMVDELAEPYFRIAHRDREHVGLVVSGNGIRLNKALQSIANKRFNMPLRLSTHDEEAALGAAMIASGSA